MGAVMPEQNLSADSLEHGGVVDLEQLADLRGAVAGI